MRELIRYLNRRRLGQGVVYLEYPYDFKPRWEGRGNPHLRQLIEGSKDRYAANIREIAALLPLARDMPFDWTNHYLPALDALSVLWAAQNTERIFIEIGSGHSTIAARQGLRPGAKLVSIDPCPRADIDRLCDEVIRQPVEHVELSVFDRLQAGDVLFFDGSHRSFANSDVTTFFLDVLPRLQPGVRIGIHDIFLPYDYPAAWKGRAYNEQYLLGAFLLANPRYFSIDLATHWVARQQMHVSPLATLWNDLGEKVRDRGCGAIWLTKEQA